MNGLLESLSLLGRDRCSNGPQLVWTGTAYSAGPGGGVGFQARRHGVVEGPIVGTTASRGGLFGSRCQRADACFDRSIVPRCPRRREEISHPELSTKRLHPRGAEGRTVIA